MATVTGALRLRESKLSTLASAVTSFNELHNLIVLSGMTQVADDEFTGQAKTFSLTASSTTTKVDVDLNSGTNFIRYVGTKTYRHPTLTLYVTVYFYIYVDPGRSSFVIFQYIVSTKLSGGTIDPTKRNAGALTFYPSNISNYDYSATIVPFDNEPISVSCGPDHFWIARKGGIKTDPKVGSSNNGYYIYPHSTLDPNGLAVFSSQTNPNVFCVIQPQAAGYMETNGIVGKLSNNSTELGAITCEYYSNGSWTKLPNGSAGYLLNPSVSTTIKGFRVAQAELIIGGAPHRFNFGFVSNGLIPELSDVNINLNGIPQNYRSAPGFGSAGPSFTSPTPSSYSIVVLPVV